MKIAKALKLKNRIAGEVSRLKGVIIAHNSRVSDQEQVYDVSETYKKLFKRIEDLVNIKTAIACANASSRILDASVLQHTAFWNVFMIAETKGLVETLRGMSTKKGTFNESNYGMSSQPVTYVATYGQKDVDDTIALMEQHIDQMQEKLDEHNATFDCQSIDGITI